VFDKAEVRSSWLLRVDGVHQIYWEESGNPHGIPVLYLHGGSRNQGGYRTKLDPSRFRIIGLDQRGCGRSTPQVTAPGYNLRQNTTSDLVDDIEKVRGHLRVDRWLVNGVSWGSTLALAYAQAHPKRVSGIVGSSLWAPVVAAPLTQACGLARIFVAGRPTARGIGWSARRAVMTVGQGPGSVRAAARGWRNRARRAARNSRRALGSVVPAVPR
jgi:pimeloyl-ACP methyl ester carboxylesterase